MRRQALEIAKFERYGFVLHQQVMKISDFVSLNLAKLIKLARSIRLLDMVRFALIFY